MNKHLYNIVIVWLLIFNGFAVSAQDALTVEQLRDSVRVYKADNPGKVIYFSNELEKQLKKQDGNIKELIKLKISIAEQLIYQNAFDLAIKKTQEAIILSDLQKDNKLKADAYKTLGNIYYQKEEYISAIKYYSVSDSLANTKLHSLKIRYNYSGIKQRIGSYEETLEIRLNLYDSLKLSDDENYKKMNINNVLSIINIYKMLIKKDPKNKQKYLDGIDKFSTIFKDYNSNVELYQIIFDLTHLSISLDVSFNKSIIVKYDSLQKVLWKKNIHFVDRMIYFDKARYYYLSNDTNKSLLLLKKIDSIEKKNPKGSLYRDEIDMLYSKVYQSLGKESLALQKMEEANRILNKKERQREIVSEVLRKRYDFYSINKKIRNLSNSKKKSKFSFNEYYLLAVLPFIVLFYFRKRLRFIDNKQTEVILQNEEESDKKISKIKKNIKKNAPHSKTIIPNEVIEESLKKIKQYEQTKLYLSPDVDLESLADFLELNRVYTSKILNDYLNIGFFDYINHLRISFAIKKIEEDEEFRNLPVEIIAKRVGYSKNSFIRIFRKITGFTPYQYIMKVKKSTNTLRK